MIKVITWNVEEGPIIKDTQPPPPKTSKKKKRKEEKKKRKEKLLIFPKHENTQIRPL